jgi:hypothetical protein
MTLANFNSNFNWQLRALKQAAECCGIIPDNVPPLPPVDCYWYVQVNDVYCSGFSFLSQEWELNGLPFSGGWNNLMIAPPYGTVGGGLLVLDPLTPCGFFSSYSSYYMWTILPSTTLTLPALTGFDSLGNPVSYNMLGPICGTKCYEGTFRSVFGSTIVYGMNTAEFNISNYSIFIDLTDPGASVNFTAMLVSYYGPGASGTVTIVGPDEYTLTINNINSLGTFVNIFMDDGVTTGVLNEIPC